jgi:hypothetical protein
VRLGEQTAQVDYRAYPIVVHARTGSPRERWFAQVSNVSMPQYIGVNANNLCQLLRGLVERVFSVEINGRRVPPPKPARQTIFSERLSYFKDRIVNHVGLCTPWSFQQFLDTYTGSKRMVYTRAIESLSLRGLCKEDAVIKAFVKFEKLLKLAAARIISPRSARYNAVVGRYLKAVEGRIYKAIALIFDGCTVMKGLNSVEVAEELRKKWDTFIDPCCVGLDASRFDQHVSQQALNWEHSVYMSLFPNYPELGRVLKWQLHNSCIAMLPEAKVKYTVKGCRMSGDMNTSLGNCLLMCAMVHAYAKQKRVKVALGNNGDDCVVFLERADLKRFMEGLTVWFLEMGFTMKVEEPCYRFEHVEFCQSRPVVVADGWVMCRSPIKALVKDSVCLHPEKGAAQEDALRAWAASVGKAGSAWAAGIPVLQDAYAALERLGNGKREHILSSQDMYSGLYVAGSGLSGRSTEILPETRASFYYAWGITPDMQLALEATLKSRSTHLTSLCIDAGTCCPSITDFQPEFVQQ